MPAKSSRTVSNGRSSTAASLHRNLEKNLLAYAAVAGASVLSLANPAEAQIVYTPSNIPIAAQDGVLTQLDLNNDGTPDFAFSNYSYRGSHSGHSFLKVSPDQAANEIWGIKIKGQKKITAAALPQGTTVGSNGNFTSDPKGLVMAASGRGFASSYVSGSWKNLETAYLGLKFVVNGEVHYGWARVKFIATGEFRTGSIFGYAYESAPNTPIVTGQTSGTATKTSPSGAVPVAAFDGRNGAPSELGLLAAGAAGSIARRGNAPIIYGN